MILTEGEILYGVRDAGSKNVWWTRNEPLGELQWRMDHSVLSKWNKGIYIEKLMVPEGHSWI